MLFGQILPIDANTHQRSRCLCKFQVKMKVQFFKSKMSMLQKKFIQLIHHFYHTYEI